MNQLIIFFFCLFLADTCWGDVFITNNNLATVGEFPYQVSVQLDGVHLCGGALISKRHVLTAAQCLDTFVLQQTPKQRITVVVGAINVFGGTRMSVDRISIHGAFQRPYLYNDIGVIRLTSSITESAYVLPINLPRATDVVYAGEELMVSGFGAVYTNGPTSAVLRKITMQAVDRLTCQQYWPHMILIGGQMCATNPLLQGVCLGDGGSPVTANKQVILGVVTGYSPYGCASGIPDLFTKVAPYLDYIQAELSLVA